MSSVIKTHTHDNYEVLKYLTESNSVLLYKGKQISGGGNGAITISPNPNNAIVKYANGYYVPAFLISKVANNGLVRYSDGYYAPKLPVNFATTDDIDVAKEKIDKDILQQTQTFNERYDIITTKIQEVFNNTANTQVHEYSGENTDLESIIDVSTIYEPSSSVILNFELLIKNSSNTDVLNIKILENGMQTLNDSLTKLEVQRYKLPNIPNIEIFIKGSYQLFLYVTYM